MLEDPGDPENPNIGHLGLKIALATFSSLGLLCIIIFCSVRNVFRDIYSPRRSLGSGRPPKLPANPFTWVATVWAVPEAFLVTTVGLDGVLLLRFLQNSAYLFTVLSVLGLLVLVPVNYFANPPTREDLDEAAYLKALTVENVPNSSPYLRAFPLYLQLSLFSAALIILYRGHVDLKLKHTEYVLRRTKLSKIEMRSLIVFGIPRELQHEVDLAAFFENLGVGSVENVVICRKWNKLRHAVWNRSFYLQQLERVYFEVRRNYSRGHLPRNLSTLVLGTLSRVFGSSTSQQNGIPSTAHNNGSHSNGSAHSMLFEEGYDNSSSTTPLLSESHRQDQRWRFSSSDSADPSLFEIMNFLDAVDPKFRPKHKNGFLGLFGDSVDSAEHYAEMYANWDAIVHGLRRSPERSPPTAVGFVTFESPESATIASQIVLSRRPFACMARMAPEPRDVYWPNLSSRAADSSVKVLRGLVVNFVLVFVVFLSTIAIITLSRLYALPSVDPDKFPILKDFFDWLGKSGTEVLQQVITTLLFNAWTSSLPSLLTILSQLQGMEALSWIEMSVYSKYYFYIIYNILLYVVGRTLWDIIDKTDLNFNTIIQILGDTMPKSSPIMLSYVILQAFAINPAQLLLAGPLVLTWLVRIAPWSRSSPRDVSDAYYPSLLTSLNYGVSYTIPTAVWVIGLTYAGIAPLILPFCAAFFAIAYFVHKYLLLYVHLPKYETGGMYIPMVVRRCLSGVIIMQISMMGVLAFKHGVKDKAARLSSMGTLLFTSTAPEWSGYVQMIVGVIPLFFFSLAMFWWFREGYEKLVRNAPIESVGKVARELAKGSRDVNPTNPAGPGMSPTTQSPVMGDVESLSGDKPKELGDVPPGRGVGGRGKPFRKRLVDGADTDSLIRRGTLLGTELLSPVIPSHRPQSADIHDLTLPPSPSLPSTSAFVSFVEPGISPAGSTLVDVSPAIRTRNSMTPSRDSIASSSPYQGREDDATYSIFEEPLESEGVIHEDDLSDGEDFSSPTAPLEPPSTRVPGILDAPLQPAVIPEGDEDESMLRTFAVSSRPHGRQMTVFDAPDLQLHTYIHPALIGRLPVAWLPTSQGSEQPRKLREARDDQIRQQRALFRRIVGLQRAGVAAIGTAGSADDDDGIEDDYGLRNGPRGIFGKILLYSTQ
ncbi:hypothetical protein HDU97_009485 [Phlyctochytrium planicorne]|nr:hypothetical protein HDU97_009485 [Phlyctochytrium planicorne]